MVSRFIKGTLAEDDFEAISEEFVDGGVLSLAVTKAQRLIGEKTIKTQNCSYVKHWTLLMEIIPTQIQPPLSGAYL